MQLTERTRVENADAVEQALLGDAGWAIARAMCSIRLGEVPDPAALARCHELGWVDAQGAVTESGYLIGDSLRELIFWDGRDRRIHLPLEPVLPDELGDCDVLEVGSGFGANVMTLAESARSAVGVEPHPIYRALAPVLARMADRPCPEILDGAGESLPFEDARFDVVLFPGSLQYMPIARSLEEAVRVLRPGGRLAIVNGEIGAATREFLGKVRCGELSLGGVREYLGMLAHPVIGRAITPCPRPVYPSIGWIRRRLARLGLRYDETLSGFSGEEFVYVADKPGATGA